MRILESGQSEPLKAGVHASALGLTIVMAAYNGAAWIQRRQSHLFWNFLIYCSACLWESAQVRRHVRHAELPPREAGSHQIAGPTSLESRAA